MYVVADVKGEPAPKVTWTVGDKPIENDRLKIENEDNKTRFLLVKAKRSDTGIYTVKAVNDSGKDEVDFELVVLSKPGKPKGPLSMLFYVL